MCTQMSLQRRLISFGIAQLHNIIGKYASSPFSVPACMLNGKDDQSTFAKSRYALYDLKKMFDS